MSDCERCRFCQSQLPEGPFLAQDEVALPPVDEPYLRQLILQIAARVKMNNAFSEPHQQLIDANKVTDDDVSQEMLRLSNSFCPSWEEELPSTGWETQLIAASEPHKKTQYGVIRNILEQADRLSSHDRLNEAQELTQFAANLISQKETDEFLCDFMLAECQTSMIKIKRRARRIKAAAGQAGQQCDAMAAAENLIQVMQGAGGLVGHPEMLQTLIAGGEEARIKALDELKGTIRQVADIVSDALTARNPESASKLREIMEGAVEAVDASSLSVRARGAFSRGDFATAEQLARRALSGLTGNTAVVAQQRAIQLCFLAEIYAEQGKAQEATALLDEAVETARHFPSAPNSEAFNRGLIFRQVAAGFEKLSQSESGTSSYLEKARQYYEQSIADCESAYQFMRTSFPGAKVAGELSNLLSVYAGVLRKMGLNAQAKDAEARAAELKESE
jgi:tetratricopeptide (TPR) repeat protein